MRSQRCSHANLKSRVIALLLALWSWPAGQTVFSQTPQPTFHIEGTFGSPWDSISNVALPRSRVTFHGEQQIKILGTDTKDSYIAVPRTEITFEGNHITRTVVVDDKGFYQADLPIGVYKMTVRGPAIAPQALKHYVRFFRVDVPQHVVLNGTLYKAKMSCDAVVGAETEQQTTQEWKNACGGEDYFPVSSKDQISLQLYIQYPRRESSARGYVYSSNQTTEPDIPVFVAYDLLTLTAEKVIYDSKNLTISATGNVSITDGSGRTQHFDSTTLSLREEKVLPVR